MAMNKWLGDGFGDFTIAPFSAPSPWPLVSSDYHGALRHMDRQMKELQRSMDHAFNHAQRHFGMTPMDFRLTEAENVLNPVVIDKDGQRKLQYTLDVRQFKPEEIEIRTKDLIMEVHAKHEENTEHGQVHREYRRLCTLPKDLDTRTLKSHLGHDGVLRIDAPLPKALEAPKEHVIPITHEAAIQQK